MRAVLCTDRALLSDILQNLLSGAGIQVVDHTSDYVGLLKSVALLRPDIVVLNTVDPDIEPGLCSHLLGEYPRLKILILSTGSSYAVADVGIRLRRFHDLSVESLRSLVDSFSTE